MRLGFAAIVALVPHFVNAQWNSYGADNRNSKYVAASAINADNAERLAIAWRWSSPDNAIARENPDLFIGLFKATPVLRGDALYIATGLHQVASVDARTGRTRWVYAPEIYERGTPQRLGFIHRGVAAWRDRILHVTGEGYLTALSIGSGVPIDDFGDEGTVDLLSGIRRPVERFEFGANSPAIIVGDVIVVGSFVQDGWLDKEGPPGDVRGYDVASGELLWTFRTIPEAGEHGVETWLESSFRQMRVGHS